MNFNCKAGRGCWTSCCAIDAAGPPQPTAAGAGRGAADAAKVGCRHAKGGDLHRAAPRFDTEFAQSDSDGKSELQRFAQRVLLGGRPASHWALGNSICHGGEDLKLRILNK